jgi:ribose transport system substrate-binding protein
MRLLQQVGVCLAMSGLVAGCGTSDGSTGPANGSSDPAVAAAKSLVTASLTASSGFTPPTTGPKAEAKGATIAYVAADVTNGGINAVATGVKEAAAKIGWTVVILDGKASDEGRTDALERAIAMKPAGIILGGFDAAEQSTTIVKATASKIPVVGWHAAAKPGPDEEEEQHEAPVRTRCAGVIAHEHVAQIRAEARQHARASCLGGFPAVPAP